jgi:hypothetical protein
MAGKPYHSCLLPYKEFIRDAREDGISYSDIAKELKDKYYIECTRQGIFQFVKTHSKKRDVIRMLDEPDAVNSRAPYHEVSSGNILGEDVDKGKTKKKAGSEEEIKEDLWNQVQQAANFDYTEKLGTWVGPKGGVK